jgi:hypothetical protein
MFKNGLFLILLNHSLSATNDTVSHKIHWNKNRKISNYSYPINIIDYTKKPYTMRQFNQNFLSTYRFSTRILSESVPKEYSDLIPVAQTMLSALYFITYTHEEGHRSVLTALNIGSISSPVFSKGVASVKGVSDNSLKNLRDSNLPNYIRLHTAGIESDYVLTQEEEELVMFQKEKIRNIYGDFAMRRLGLFLYLFSGAANQNSALSEEKDELERDVVGDDVLGAVRHLHRPNMPFFRYTAGNDMTITEKKYLSKVSYLSFLNLLSPVFIGKTTLAFSNKLNIGFSTGYILAPFGDMIEQNIYLQNNQKWSVRAFFRQFGNYHAYFLGGGLSLSNFNLSEKFIMNTSAQCWNQPEELGFYSTKGTIGGALEIKLGYIISMKPKAKLNSISLDVTFRYKTDGFIPQDPFLKEAFNTSVGITFYPL